MKRATFPSKQPEYGKVCTLLVSIRGRPLEMTSAGRPYLFNSETNEMLVIRCGTVVKEKGKAMAHLIGQKKNKNAFTDWPNCGSFLR